VSLVVLDTDVASAILRARVPDRLRARLASKTPCITFVTLGELTKWTILRSSRIGRYQGHRSAVLWRCSRPSRVLSFVA
jgi:predicted nucleic acid-binding protein